MGMAGIQKLDFESPDEVRTPEKTRVDVVKVGATTAARMTAQPGWKWSEHIKPIVGGDKCQARHVGYLASGSIHVVHDDGTEADLSAGDAYVIEPGHDAWVVGDEPFVGYEFETTTAEAYAKGS
jgi:hypothetical protein